jgi:site-specific recombinase XerD
MLKVTEDYSKTVAGTVLTRKRLYHRMLSLGKRAGVADAHPHRFRDTFAVDMLARGATAYDVAKLLGDTIETVGQHYAEFVKDCGSAYTG